jgi:CO dehydrogenase/acetyl-CoA synthase alpha subunit
MNFFLNHNIIQAAHLLITNSIFTAPFCDACCICIYSEGKVCVGSNTQAQAKTNNMQTQDACKSKNK